MPRMLPMNVTHRTNSRSRSVRVSIAPTGEVIVTRPPRFPLWRAEQFLESSRDWIEKNLRRMKLLSSVYQLDDSRKSLLFRGLVYPVEVVEHGAQPPVKLVDGKIIIAPVEKTPSSVRRALERWLRAESERTLVKKIHSYADKMEVRVGNVVFKSASTRWGSCSSTGNINLHWRLIQAPDPVSEYVIIHELAHRREMNHGPKFWKLVEVHDSEYRNHRTWLKKHGVLLHSNIWE